LSQIFSISDGLPVVRTGAYHIRRAGKLKCTMRGPEYGGQIRPGDGNAAWVQTANEKQGPAAGAPKAAAAAG